MSGQWVATGGRMKGEGVAKKMAKDTAKNTAKNTVKKTPQTGWHSRGH
jgi:hypothetical protein